MLGRCKEIKDNFESRGPSKLLEYGAYEARLFGEMLLKGSVIILEVNDGKMWIFNLRVLYDIHHYNINIIGKTNISYKLQGL